MNLENDPVIHFIKGFSQEQAMVTRVTLYGSRARGDFKPKSDYDFCFWFAEGDRAVIGNIFEMVRQRNPTLFALDLVNWTDASEGLRAAITQQGKVIYEK